MESLEQLRARFETLTELRSLVGTMKALAAVGVHRLDEAARSVGQYDRTIEPPPTSSSCSSSARRPHSEGSLRGRPS